MTREPEGGGPEGRRVGVTSARLRTTHLQQIKVSAIYLVAFFTPLFAIELSTFSLLLLFRRISITRYSMFFTGAMFIVFAMWALEGFSYPSSPVPFALNGVSKVLSFAGAVALFSYTPNQVAREQESLAAAAEGPTQ